MTTNRFTATATATVCASLLAVPLAMAAQHQHASPADTQAGVPTAQPKKTEPAKNETVIKVGKSGEVTFDVETLVGETRLQPGKYVLQHRADGADHVVHFAGPTTADVRCRLEMLDHKAPVTEVHTARDAGTVRVTKVLIRGENAAHLF